MSTTFTLIAVFAVFIPALILPGPDFIAVVRSSMTRGTKSGLQTTLGVTTGLGLYATLSLVGLSAILVEYQWMAWAVRILGGCYLIYLGIRLLFADPMATAIHAERTAQRGNAFVFGFLVTMTNPKAVVLFTSVFATAVNAETPFWLLALMIVLVMLCSVCWYACVCLFMSSRIVVARFQHLRHRIERVAGACFVAIGGRILFDARSPVSA